MATYAVGDIQGCYDPLNRLLDACHFDPAADQLWVVGDMVNRGPDSLATLRLLQSLDRCVVAVLGNHDLHLLAVALDNPPQQSNPTLKQLLEAKDRAPLLDWLRQRPFLHEALIETESGPEQMVMTHAGIPPIWSLIEARSHAQEAAELLRGKNHPRYLRGMYGNKPDRWSPQLTGIARFRAITNYFTRMRFCAADGRLELTVKESSAAAPRGFAPWFTLPMRHDEPPYTLLFGHWAALDGHTGRNDRLALDTGCVWGRRMTMLRLEDRHPFTVACR